MTDLSYQKENHRAREILLRLKKEYLVKGPFVAYGNALELVVGTILSAQCTDKMVNKVTKELFKKYKTAKDYAFCDIKTLEKDIYSTGFYKNKAKYLKNLGKMLMEKHRGKVPGNLEDLLHLPGIAKKTAHLVMAKAFKKHTGIAVDTHVSRLAPRLGLTNEKNPDKIALDLEKLYPRQEYLNVNEYFIMHGRKICIRIPKCHECVLADICPNRRDLI